MTQWRAMPSFFCGLFQVEVRKGGISYLSQNSDGLIDALSAGYPGRLTGTRPRDQHNDKTNMSDVSHPAMEKSKWRRVVIPIVLSLFAPGVGQIYNGQVRKGAILGLTIPLLIYLSLATGFMRYFAGFLAYAVLAVTAQLVAVGDAFWVSWQKSKSGSDVINEERKPRVASAVLVAACFWITFVFRYEILGLRAYYVPTSSMVPAIIHGDRVFAQSGYYKNRLPQRGDVILFHTPSNTRFFKRVIAVPGDIIEGKSGKVYLNGTVINEPYIVHLQRDTRPRGWQCEFGPIAIPKDKLFVMGDNRNNSIDSRTPDFGLVGLEAVEGKPLYIYWSSDKARIGRRIR